MTVLPHGQASAPCPSQLLLGTPADCASPGNPKSTSLMLPEPYLSIWDTTCSQADRTVPEIGSD